MAQLNAYFQAPPPILFAKYASFCKQPSNTNYVGRCFFEIFENIK